MAAEYLSFMDTHGNKYVVQRNPTGYGYILRIGRVHEWTEQALTFESEYQSIGDVPRAYFRDRVTPTPTDNPDFVKRAALWYIGVNN